MKILNSDEQAAVRYYTGDVSGNDPFWSCPKAYLVLNSLMYPGISTETARACEGKFLEPELLSSQSRLEELFFALLSACKKSAPESELKSFRVERYSDFLINQKAGYTISFTSTSSDGFLSRYQDRKGIALLFYSIPAGTPCIQMSEALDIYTKADEAEILLPPFLELKLTQIPVSGQMLSIKDSSGEPPYIACEAVPGGVYETDNPIPFPEGGNAAGMRVYNALNCGQAPCEDDVRLYTAWKDAFRQKINSAAVSVFCR